MNPDHNSVSFSIKPESSKKRNLALFLDEDNGEDNTAKRPRLGEPTTQDVAAVDPPRADPALVEPAAIEPAALEPAAHAFFNTILISSGIIVSLSNFLELADLGRLLSVSKAFFFYFAHPSVRFSSPPIRSESHRRILQIFSLVLSYAIINYC